MKKALLLSGGYDSVASLLIQKDKNFDCIFFDYDQSYIEYELNAVRYIESLGFEVKIIKTSWKTDIKNRNFLMILRVSELGYNSIILGTRNILPMFDKYKDSNWLSLKFFGLLTRIKISMPVAIMPKSKIKNIVKSKVDISKLYSTEKE